MIGSPWHLLAQQSDALVAILTASGFALYIAACVAVLTVLGFVFWSISDCWKHEPKCDDGHPALWTLLNLTVAGAVIYYFVRVPHNRLRGEEPPTLEKTFATSLGFVASLKLTVALFSMLIVIVFVGTLAQSEESMWTAVHRYFYSSFVLIKFDTFFPKSFFPFMPHLPDSLFGAPIGIPFPGAGLIGTLLLVNLLAAHLLRFKIQTRGLRLAAGLAVIALGVAVTVVVILSGQNAQGLQGVPFFVQLEGGEQDWTALWRIIKFGLLPLSIFGGSAATVGLFRNRRYIEAALTGGVSAALLALTVFLVAIVPNFVLDDSGLRILWQLMQGSLAGIVLLIGCILAFKQRGGMVVLHAGVVLLIIGMFYVAYFAVEEQMTIFEGETASEAVDTRKVELAVIDHASKDKDVVVAVPRSRLKVGETFSHEYLPFDVELVEYFPNSEVVRRKSGEASPADQGVGRYWMIEQRRVGAGADSGGEVDIASAYVKLIEKGTHKTIGTYLVSQHMRAEPVMLGDESYDIKLRFKTTPKPYTITLEKFRKDDYMGTNTPMNFSSDIHLVDRRNNEDRHVKIWMNNPLRYAGETFYQSGFTPNRDGTTLQIVTNSGWMMPYAACMIVAIGMLAHFWIVLVRFLKRLAAGDFSDFLEDRRTESDEVVDAELSPEQVVELARRPKKPAAKPRRAAHPAETASALSIAGIVIPAAVALLAAGGIGYSLRTPTYGPTDMNLYKAGKLPVMYQGRVKPLDTLGRNSLRIISNLETFVDEDGKTQPAIRWLMDVISGVPEAERYKVFRIDNLEVLDVFGLKRREGFKYSLSELKDGFEEFLKQLARVKEREENRQQLSAFDNGMLQTERRIREYQILRDAFRPPAPPPLPTLEEIHADENAALAKLDQVRLFPFRVARHVNAMNPPLVVPGRKPTDAWQAYSVAWSEDFVNRIAQKPVNANTNAWETILASYLEGDPLAFNAAVTEYDAALDANPPKQLAAAKTWFESPFRPVTDFEAFFNHFSPFFVCQVLYVCAFVLTCVGMLCALFGWQRPFNRAAWFLILITFAVHTAALLARMYISGRPPVTNLYSSAVFIGWVVVGMAIVLELLLRIGVGNIVASVVGFATLTIAYLLAGDGDTMAVLQAVLDTQFWLATHVVTITLGYSTTYLAGALGMATIFVALIVGNIAPEESKFIERMLYKITFGVVCFAIFFSFVGTVLGGLWADDSWGRFWGWDPKENGAAIIVIWNAVVLHARWDKLVGPRGFAVLAVLGNIVTSWSWFGVNQLGIGLHSYGFHKGVLTALTVFVASQLLIAGLGIGLTQPGLKLLKRMFPAAE